MFVSVKLCDLVGFPTFPEKYSKGVNLRNLVFRNLTVLYRYKHAMYRCLRVLYRYKLVLYRYILYLKRGKFLKTVSIVSFDP